LNKRFLFIAFMLLALATSAVAQTVTAERVKLTTGPCMVRSGSGDPDGVVVGNICDAWLRSDTGTLYLKTTGADHHGWTLLTSGGVTGTGTGGYLTGWTGTSTLGATGLTYTTSSITGGTWNAGAVTSSAAAANPNRHTLTLTNTDPNSKSTMIAMGVYSTLGSWLIGTDYTQNKADDFWIYGGGSGGGRAMFNAAGDVGLGGTITNNALSGAAFKLTAAGAATFAAGVSATTFTATATNALLSNAESWIGPSSTTGIYFKGGNVGIGTTAPTSFLLQVAGHTGPNTGYTSDLGSLQTKWRSIHAAELWVETLVAQNTIATIGGRVLVAPTTTLVADLTAIATTIHVKHNQMASGDRVYLEADGKVEFLSIDSAAGGSAGDYTYTVTRNLDGSGANVWYAGDAMLNTGTTGDGFIDLYSVSGVLSGYGPTIVGNVRTGTTYNNIAPRWAAGNLYNLYDYGADTYGFAAGNYSTTWVSVDATNGFRVNYGAAERVHIDASGNAAFTGTVTASAGAIGGWVIGAADLKDVAGVVGLSSAVTGGDDIRFWAGHATPASAPFIVTEAGAVTMTSGSVALGTVTLNSSGVTVAQSDTLGTDNAYRFGVAVAQGAGLLGTYAYDPFAGGTRTITMRSTSTTAGKATTAQVYASDGTKTASIAASTLSNASAVGLSADTVSLTGATTVTGTFGVAGVISVDANGDWRPVTDNTRSVGLSGARFATMYATTFYGALSGNASTASTAAALTNNPSDCAANAFAYAIDASGALTCTAGASAATASTLVLRDGSGDSAFHALTANHLYLSETPGAGASGEYALTYNTTSDIVTAVIGTTTNPTCMSGIELDITAGIVTFASCAVPAVSPAAMVARIVSLEQRIADLETIIARRHP
jgi:hypothetical protein